MTRKFGAKFKMKATNGLVLFFLTFTSIFFVGCSSTKMTLTGNLSVFGKFTSNQFEPPETCMSCHHEIHGQWTGSMHNNAYNDPLYQSVLQYASKDTKSDQLTEAFCVACHNPIGFISGEIPPIDGSLLSAIAKNGVQCDYCHTVSKQHGIGNFSNNKSPGETKRGPFSDAVSPQHKTAFSSLHKSSKFCGSCHNVKHPLNNLPLENTYTEWEKGPYKDLGIQCQDCHMTPGPGVTKPNPGQAAIMGPKRPHIYTHLIVGGNVALAEHFGSVHHAEAARERLKAAAKVEIMDNSSIKIGNKSNVKVKVTNIGAGHYLPTGLTETRQMWLNIKVKDKSGKLIYSSGDINENGEIEENSIIYNTVVGDKEGKPTHAVWRADIILYDHRIPPKKSVTENIVFNIPKTAKEPIEVKATLKYRSAPQELVNELMGSNAFELPIIDMASDSKTF